MRRVIKFGGTSVATPALVRAGAECIARLVERGEQIAVVVSAPGNATSELLEQIYAAGDGHAGFNEICEYAALGEELCVRQMAAALASCGVRSAPLLPRERRSWPIIANIDDDSPLSTAKINEERPFDLIAQQTATRFKRHVLPLLRTGSVPVFAGAFAVSTLDRVVSFGRGGSDITAFIVAHQIDADEVVIVSDVQGVLSADPRLAERALIRESYSNEEMQALALGGARVIHRRALQYMTDRMRARFVSYDDLSQLEESGTSVMGRSETSIVCEPERLTQISLVGVESDSRTLFGLLGDWESAEGISPAAVSATRRFTCYFVPESSARDAYRRLSELLAEAGIEYRNLAMREGLGELRLCSSAFIDEPGVLGDIMRILANRRINVIEMVTGLTDISVFLDYTELERANRALKIMLESYER